MTVTRDVITDLLPIYLAGEASADTRTLLESYLREHPDFAKDVHDRAERGVDLLSGARPSLPPDLERSTLERARRFNARRTRLMGVAIMGTLMPLGFRFDGSGVTWLMVRDSPAQALGWWAVAAACWIGYSLMGRRLAAMKMK